MGLWLRSLELGRAGKTVKFVLRLRYIREAAYQTLSRNEATVEGPAPEHDSELREEHVNLFDVDTFVLAHAGAAGSR